MKFAITLLSFRLSTNWRGKKPYFDRLVSLSSIFISSQICMLPIPCLHYSGVRLIFISTDSPTAQGVKYNKIISIFQAQVYVSLLIFRTIGPSDCRQALLLVIRYFQKQTPVFIECCIQRIVLQGKRIAYLEFRYFKGTEISLLSVFFSVKIALQE